MRIDEIEARKCEIRSMLDGDIAALDIDALTEEVRALDSEKAEIEKRNAAEAELRAAVEPAVIAEITENKKKEERKMETVEIRNSAEYVKAYADYIRTGDDRECRKLTTENASGGTVAVPEIVYESIKHAWDSEQLMSIVKKTAIKGNLKIGFERSASGAVVHTEGGDAIDEETLTLGIVSLVPETIKKWISVSDEVLDMDDGSFLRYIYEELTYQIAKKAADDLVAAVVATTTTGSATSPAEPEITANSIALGTVAAAVAQLSDEADNPVIVMNKQTYAAFKAVQYAGNYSVDPFEGLRVVFNSSLPAFSAASAGNVYAIVGDFSKGAIANMPNGEITIKMDDTTLATADLVRVIGRYPVALGVVAPKAFCKIKK